MDVVRCPLCGAEIDYDYWISQNAEVPCLDCGYVFDIDELDEEDR
jgi:rubredoxin